jgi:hypothetical protein
LWFGDSGGRGTTSVNWRTEVKIEKYTKDRFLSKLTMESLTESISAKFNEAMKRKKVVVYIAITPEKGEKQKQEVHPKDFEGMRLPEVRISRKDAGDTIFRLFLARPTVKGKIGKVRVGEINNDFRISFAMFARSLPEGCKLSEEAVQAFTSGIFEGDILSSKAKFHSSRRGFETGDALVGFAESIDAWFIEHGLEPFLDAKETKQAERYQNWGLRSLKVLEELVKGPAGEQLRKVIESFRYGTIGDGHVDRPGSETSYRAISTEGSHGAETESDARSKTSPALEREGHHPFTSVGPRGKKRVIVRSGSLGIQLVHEPMGSEKLYELEVDNGLLRVNIQHPLWVMCEEAGEKAAMRFQEWLMLQALSIEAIPEDFREFARLAVETQNAPYAYMLINADSWAGRIIQSRKSAMASRDETSKKPKSIVLSKKTK